MLNRRILRIKAFKVLYSYAENRTLTLNEALSALDISCEATRDLYLLMLSIAGPLTAEAARRAEAASHKFNPTEEELHPNLKFVHNALAPLLREDPDFQKLLERKKLSWDQDDAWRIRKSPWRRTSASSRRSSRTNSRTTTPSGRSSRTAPSTGPTTCPTSSRRLSAA